MKPRMAGDISLEVCLALGRAVVRGLHSSILHLVKWLIFSSCRRPGYGLA